MRNVPRRSTRNPTAKESDGKATERIRVRVRLGLANVPSRSTRNPTEDHDEGRRQSVKGVGNGWKWGHYGQYYYMGRGHYHCMRSSNCYCLPAKAMAKGTRPRTTGSSVSRRSLVLNHKMNDHSDKEDEEGG